MNEHQNHQDRAVADVGAQRIARVYAEALMGAAQKRGEVDVTWEQLDSLVRDVFQANPLIEQFFASPAVPSRVKSAQIQSLFAERGTELFTNFLLVLNEHGRLDLLRVIRSAFHDLDDERTGRLHVLVRSAAPLAGDQQERLRQELRTAFQREPVLETRIEPDLIGGMVVKARDWQFDASVRTRLQTIRHYLIERSSHEIQSGRDRFSSDT